MDKRSFFIKALSGDAHLKRDWVLSIFSVFQEPEDAWTKNPYPYRLVLRNDMMYFIDLDKNGDFTIIDDYVYGKPLFSVKDKILLHHGDLPNVVEKTQTTYGNVLFNAVCLCWPFGGKIPFITGRVNSGELNREIVKRLKDNPDPSKGDISVDELLRYGEAVSSLGGYTQLCVPAATPKSLTVDPKVIALRDELLKKHKDELHDPSVVANIEKQLIELDKATMKGDEAEGFLISKKSYDVVRKKMYIMHGLEGGFGGASEMTFIPTSLKEGWDIENLPAMADSLRFGSYNRGNLTALGGESVKYFHRVFQNTKVIPGDCGDTVGMSWTITDDNYGNFEGLFEQTTKGPKELDLNYLKTLVGKTITVRSPSSCKSPDQSFCEFCIGTNLSRNPSALLINASNVGSKFMSIFMAKMHGVALKTEKMDINEFFT